MDIDLISRKEARELLYKRLYETALNNVGVCMDGIEEVYQDIADNRLDTWISEIPPADEIKVGDEVIYDREKCVVTAIANGGYTIMLLGLGGGYMVRTTRDEIQGKCTGRHFPQVGEVLKQMQEEK